jgi:hypothetical protein
MKTTIASVSFVLLTSLIVGCGKSSQGGDGLSVAPGDAISAFLFDEDSKSCLNDQGHEGLNRELGQCSDLNTIDEEQVFAAIEKEVDLSGSNGEAMDFSGSSLDMEYILVYKIVVNDATVLGDGSYFDETEVNNAKVDLCTKWLLKRNKKTGLFPSGIQKKISRLGCE